MFLYWAKCWGTRQGSIFSLTTTGRNLANISRIWCLCLHHTAPGVHRCSPPTCKGSLFLTLPPSSALNIVKDFMGMLKIKSMYCLLLFSSVIHPFKLFLSGNYTTAWFIKPHSCHVINPISTNYAPRLKKIVTKYISSLIITYLHHLNLLNSPINTAQHCISCTITGSGNILSTTGYTFNP